MNKSEILTVSGNHCDLISETSAQPIGGATGTPVLDFRHQSRLTPYIGSQTTYRQSDARNTKDLTVKLTYMWSRPVLFSYSSKNSLHSLTLSCVSG